MRGNGVPADQAKALAWYEKAEANGLKKAGQSVAMTKGRLLFDAGLAAYSANKFGDTVAHWEKAAELGYPEAIFNLGVIHEHGTGVPADLTKALAWYEKAAARGVPAAPQAVAGIKARLGAAKQ